MTADATMTEIEKENIVTTPQFGTVEEQAEGDKYSPQDHVGHVIVVKPSGIRSGVPSKQRPGEFIDGLKCDILDLDSTERDDKGQPKLVYRNSILFGGSFVDSMRSKLGQLVVVTIGMKRSSTSPNSFAYPIPAGQTETARAGAYWAANGDPFTVFDTTDPFS